MFDFLKEIPLFGGCFEADKSDYWEALQELSGNLLWATTPIWLGMFVLFLTGEGENGNVFKATLGNGELFIYATTLLSSTFWTLLHKPKGAKDIKNIFSLFNCVVLVMLLASVAFVIQRAGPTVKFNAFRSSIVLFIISIVILYLVLVFHKSRLDPTAKRREIEKNQSQSYAEHRSKKNKGEL